MIWRAKALSGENIYSPPGGAVKRDRISHLVYQIFNPIGGWSDVPVSEIPRKGRI